MHPALQQLSQQLVCCTRGQLLAHDGAQAKTILMRTHQVSEDQAYDLIREQAMNKRIV
ncbi:response regulator receiver/ANTAR domain-containing protein 1 [Alcaligenes faecalis subsp. faecalis NCIB 8687]|nr:response regulator receiver/ANTAR domain-containing protein 1 [Alcaligenes faecalis subsp. faecalis NCIB 8687]